MTFTNTECERSEWISSPQPKTQLQIVERVAKGHAEIGKLEAGAQTRAESAKADVEVMILGIKPVH